MLPIHLLWQLNQGGHYFEYKKAKLKGDMSRARKELFITLAVPFAFHAFWDSALDVCGYLIGEKLGTWADISGGLLLLALVVLVIVHGEDIEEDASHREKQRYPREFGGIV